VENIVVDLEPSKIGEKTTATFQANVHISVANSNPYDENITGIAEITHNKEKNMITVNLTSLLISIKLHEIISMYSESSAKLMRKYFPNLATKVNIADYAELPQFKYPMPNISQTVEVPLPNKQIRTVQVTANNYNWHVADDQIIVTSDLIFSK